MILRSLKICKGLYSMVFAIAGNNWEGNYLSYIAKVSLACPVWEIKVVFWCLWAFCCCAEIDCLYLFPLSLAPASTGCLPLLVRRFSLVDNFFFVLFCKTSSSPIGIELVKLESCSCVSISLHHQEQSVNGTTPPLVCTFTLIMQSVLPWNCILKFAPGIVLNIVCDLADKNKWVLLQSETFLGIHLFS